MVIHVPRRVCTLFGLAPSPSVVAVSSAASALAEDLPHRVLAVVTVGGSYADDHACAGAEMDDICAAQAGAGLAAQIDYVDDKPYGRAFPNFGEDDLKFANIAKCCLRVVTSDRRRRRQDGLGRLTPIEYETIMTSTATQAA